MRPKSNPLVRASRLAFIAVSFATLPSFAGTIWDATKNDLSPASNTHIDNNENWDADVVNALGGTTAITSFTGGSSAMLNVNASFTAVTLNRAAEFSIDGPNNLILMSVNSGSSTNLVLASTAGGNQTLNAPLQVNTTNTTNKFLSFSNNSNSRVLDINGAISRSATSTADFALRFQNAAGSVTRIDGPISNMSNLQQGFGGGAVAGDLIFGGNRTSTAAINIGTTSSGINPATTARLFLGESPADAQTWGNISLQNTIKLVIGGNITAGTISVGGNATAANTRVVGNSEANSTLSLTGGTISNLATLGGGDTNENHFNLTKAGPGTLAISGGTHTFTGTTTVNGGVLNLSGSIASPVVVNPACSFIVNPSGSTSSAVTVNGGAAIAGEGAIGGVLTFGAGNSTLNFDPATQTAALTADTVDVSDPATSVIISPTAALTNGTPYVVLKRISGIFSELDRTKFALALRGGSTSITGGGTEITLTPAASTPVSLVWKGTSSSVWDTATTLNWTNAGNPDRFYSNDTVTFNDDATSFNVAVSGSVIPGNVLFDHSSNAYLLTGSGIGGSGSITKNGAGLATLACNLSNTGGIVVAAGTLNLTGTNTFTGGIAINGGELQFSGATIAASLNSQTVTLNGGTITFKGAATLTSDTQLFNITANDSTIKTDTAATVTWRIGSKLTGGKNFVKSGAGVLALGLGNNNPSPASDFTGTLTVTAGTLDIRHADSLGDASPGSGTEIRNATLLMQNFGQTAGTIVVDEPLAFTGNAFLTSYCQELKAFTHEFNGNITVAAGAAVGFSTARTGTNTIPVLELKGASITTNAGSSLNFGQRPATYPGGSSASAQTVNVLATVSGPGSVTAQGDAGSVHTLSAPGYGGDTTVNSATLKLDAANANNQASAVRIAATGAALELNFTGTDIVDKLFIGGVQQAAGVYKATDNPDTGTGIAQITGTGTLTVSSNPPAGFAAWAGTNAPGQTVDQDHDFDGVANGIEYFMGLSGSSFTANPAALSGTITWPMGAGYTGVYGTDYVVQTSSDLGSWANVAVGGVTIVAGTSISYTLPNGAGRHFVRLLVNAD